MGTLPNFSREFRLKLIPLYYKDYLIKSRNPSHIKKRRNSLLCQLQGGIFLWKKTKMEIKK